MKRVRVVVVVVAFAVMCNVGVARADDAADAGNEMAQAQTALDQNDFPSALLHFSSAQKLAPQASGPLLGLGLTYAGLDRCGDAVALLEEYRRRKGANANPKAKHAIDVCAKRPQNGTLILDSRPSEVEVRRDIAGQPLMGTTPLTATLPVGRHVLLLNKAGYLPSTVSVTIRPGVDTHELAGLRLDDRTTPPPVIVVTPPPAALPSTAAPPSTNATTNAQLTAPPPEKKSHQGLAIGLGVTAAILVIAGVIVGVVVGTHKTPRSFPEIDAK